MQQRLIDHSSYRWQLSIAILWLDERVIAEITENCTVGYEKAPMVELPECPVNTKHNVHTAIS